MEMGPHAFTALLNNFPRAIAKMEPQSLEEVRTDLVVCSCYPWFLCVENSIGQMREQRQALNARRAVPCSHAQLCCPLGGSAMFTESGVCTLCAQCRHWRRQRQGSPATPVSCAHGCTASQQCASQRHASAVRCTGCRQSACCWHAASGRLMHQPRLTGPPAPSAAPTAPSKLPVPPSICNDFPSPTHRARHPPLPLAEPGELHHLHFSPPCQSLSSMNASTTAAEARGTLTKLCNQASAAGTVLLLSAGHLPVAAGC